MLFTKRKIIVTITGIALFIAAAYGLFQLSKMRTFQLFGKLVNRVDTNEKVIALTFDDGPTEYTPLILKSLKDENVKATFYVIGAGINAEPEIAKQIFDDGHELGNHTYIHSRMVLKTYDFIANEIEQTDKLIRNLGYTGEITFRPPNGKKLVALPWYLKQHNRTTIMWDVEPETYPAIAIDSEKIYEHVIENTKPGSIILLHGMCKSCEQTRIAVPKIIAKLKSDGYQFVTISDLLKYQ